VVAPKRNKGRLFWKNTRNQKIQVCCEGGRFQKNVKKGAARERGENEVLNFTGERGRPVEVEQTSSQYR